MAITAIFSDLGDVDCSTIPTLWAGISDINVLRVTRDSDYTREDIWDAIRNEGDTLIMAGHGTPAGLLGYVAPPRMKPGEEQEEEFDTDSDMFGYTFGFNTALGPAAGRKVKYRRPSYRHMETIVDSQMARDIHADKVIAVWCHASDFAKSNHLYGFWSSMFISNSAEARYCGFPGVPNELIVKETIKFFRDANVLLKAGVPLEEWPDRIRAVGNMNYPTTKYNYDGLKYFPK